MEIPIKMANRCVVLILALAVVAFSFLALAQTARPQQAGAAKDQKPATYIDGWGNAITAEASTAPAPRHDISGIWDPVGNRGVQPMGAGAMPEDGKPEHQLPYTPLGLEKLNLTKPSDAHCLEPEEGRDHKGPARRDEKEVSLQSFARELSKELGKEI